MRRIGIALAAFVALASYRFLLPGWPGAPPLISANLFAMPLLPIHAVFGATALLIGPFQFMSNLRRRRPRLHRVLGRAYLLCCFISGAAGLPLAFGSVAGPVASAGFAALGTIWIAATGLGFFLAMQRRLEAHRRWMIRSYALAFSAVTLRFYLPLPLLLGVDFLEGYRIISFLCWVPNLIAAELYITRANTPGRG